MLLSPKPFWVWLSAQQIPGLSKCSSHPCRGQTIIPHPLSNFLEMLTVVYFTVTYYFWLISLKLLFQDMLVINHAFILTLQNQMFDPRVHTCLDIQKLFFLQKLFFSLLKIYFLSLCFKNYDLFSDFWFSDTFLGFTIPQRFLP
jgi:hypothetical protein